MRVRGAADLAAEDSMVERDLILVEEALSISVVVWVAMAEVSAMATRVVVRAARAARAAKVGRRELYILVSAPEE